VIQEHARCRGPAPQHIIALVAHRSIDERHEPLRQRRQFERRWPMSLCVQLRGDVADDACRLVIRIAARSRHRREGPRARQTLEQQRRALVRQHACRSVAIPPHHQPASPHLLGMNRDLEHASRAIREPDGQ
jgi:hypothetical protein